MKDQPFACKPVALQSAATGQLGGSRMQYHLRQSLTSIDALMFPKPEVIVTFAAKKFDEKTLELTDQPTRDMIKLQLESFEKFVRRVGPEGLSPPTGRCRPARLQRAGEYLTCRENSPRRALLSADSCIIYYRAIREAFGLDPQTWTQGDRHGERRLPGKRAQGKSNGGPPAPSITSMRCGRPITSASRSSTWRRSGR